MLNCCRLRGDGEYRRTDLRWTTTSWAGPWDTTTRRGSCRRWRARDMFTSLFVILRLCFKFLQDQQLALVATIIRECWSLIQVKAGVSWFLRLKNIFFAQVMVAEAVANVGVTVTTVPSSVMSSTRCTPTTITNIMTEPANRRVTGQHLRLRQNRSAWQIIWQPTDTRINNITFRSVSRVCHVWVTNMSCVMSQYCRQFGPISDLMGAGDSASAGVAALGRSSHYQHNDPDSQVSYIIIMVIFSNIIFMTGLFYIWRWYGHW